MIDPKKAAKLIRQHFEELTTEQFVENLHRSCPEIFEDQKQSHQVNTPNLISSHQVKPTGNK
ncbi:MAG: hypothetical protein AB4206_14415 [Xenococcaceae cyanobacterium]